MQSAFGFLKWLPAPGARIFTGVHGRGAVRAANTGVAAIVERVVWHVMLSDVLPDVRVGPCRQGIELHQLKLVVPLHQTGMGAGWRLIPADAGDPGGISLKRLYKWLYFPKLASAIGLPKAKCFHIILSLLVMV